MKYDSFSHEEDNIDLSKYYVDEKKKSIIRHKKFNWYDNKMKLTNYLIFFHGILLILFIIFYITNTYLHDDVNFNFNLKDK
jgi:hypothetical protein